MTSRTPTQHTRHFYETHALQPATLERMVRLEHEHRRARLRGRSLLRMAAGAGLAAGLAAALAVSTGGPWQRSGAGTPPEVPGALASAIAGEISLNHLKDRSVEFAAARYADLAGRMDRLDFRVVPPTAGGHGALRVLGARYCSIQGRIAAQIKLEDALGRTLTLYETRLTPALESLEPGVELRDGIRIEIWREGDVLFGLASPEG